MTRFKRTGLIDSLLLACLVCILIKPLFSLVYLDNWPSIESTFIADARMLLAHLPHPGWQPLWYCGTRTDYIYPPALRYGTVLISLIGRVAPARAYHLYTAIFYVLGIVAVYWLVRIGSRSRASALLASLATALLSPSFLLLRNIRRDSGYWVPQRLHVLMAYGEGPHVAALAILPLALAAAWVALRSWRPAALAAAGVLCALIIANNFYGATALAIFYPILVWSVWLGERRRGVWIRGAAIPLITCGLSAFWLTPSYLRVTLTDLKLVSPPGTIGAQLILLAVIVIYGFTSFRAGRGRPERMWPVFVYGTAVVVSVYVLGYFYFNLNISGNPARLVPELDLVLILACVEALRTAWKKPGRRIPALVLVLVAFLPAVRYFRHAWSPFPKAAPLENVFQYKTTKWVADHLPGARVLPSGTVRYWFDVWADNAQPAGGADQGMLNQNIPDASWQILHGERADLAVLWLQALGTDAVVVPGKTSPEPYHDYQAPEKFRGVLPVLYDDRQGTVIYSIPRVHPGLARVVDRAAMSATGKISGGDDLAGLTKYASVVENPAQPAASNSWRGFDTADIEAKSGAGQEILFQETWDPAWHAYENGRELTIRPENTMGFMLIDVPPGAHNIRLQFETPLENRIGIGIFFVSVILVIWLLFQKSDRKMSNS
jgi:hypothetical protein